VQRFRMSGDIPSLPLCAFIKWTGTTFKLEIKTNSMIDDEENNYDIQTGIFGILIITSRGFLEISWGRTLTISL
jgi:hypothetical protein